MGFLKTKIQKIFIGLVAVSALLVVTGCVDKTDLKSYEHMTALREVHLQLLDAYTFKEGKVWDSEKFENRQRKGADKFKKAIHYEKSRKKVIRSRVKAFETVYDQYQADVRFIRKRAVRGNYFLSPILAKSLKEQVAQNYALALEGELARGQ